MPCYSAISSTPASPEASGSSSWLDRRRLIAIAVRNVSGRRRWSKLGECLRPRIQQGPERHFCARERHAWLPQGISPRTFSPVLLNEVAIRLLRQKSCLGSPPFETGLCDFGHNGDIGTARSMASRKGGGPSWREKRSRKGTEDGANRRMACP